MSLRQVVLTRPLERAQPLARRLTDAGFEVLLLPALSIVPIGHAQSIAKSITTPRPSPTIDPTSTEPCTAADQFDVVVFVSRAAWQYYDSGLQVSAQTSRESSCRVWPANTLLACVGQSTAQCMAQDLGCSLADIVFPDEHQSQDSEALLTLLTPRLVPGSRVLLVRGETGRDWLADQLRARGVLVTCLAVYRRQAVPWRADQIDTLRQWSGLAHVPANRPAAGVWLVTSAEGLAAIETQFETLGWFDYVAMCPEAVVVIHPRLEPLVRRWIGRWTRGSDVTQRAGAPIAAIPVVVAQPANKSCFKVILALGNE